MGDIVAPAAAATAKYHTTVLVGRSTDDEASVILDELSALQAWCLMQMRHDKGAVSAADLVQRTRILIVERCKRPTNVDAGA